MLLPAPLQTAVVLSLPSSLMRVFPYPSHVKQWTNIPFIDSPVVCCSKEDAWLMPFTELMTPL